jgi:hypothetical protein
MNALQKLNAMRQAGGSRRTVGLADATIERFLKTDPLLAQAIDEGFAAFEVARSEFPALLALDEAQQMAEVQAGFVNFYADDAVNPYVAVAARGPWVVTLKGAVVHDNGGYGMLGAGHAPQFVIDAMARPQVMANIMTPSPVALAPRPRRCAARSVIRAAAAPTRISCA